MIELRQMRPIDVDAATTLEGLSVAFPWPGTQFIDSMKSRHDCAVLLAQQQIIGFSVFSRVLDEATLLNIALHPDQQGNGYGRRLLEHGINHQIEAGAQRFILEVRVSNRLAISLYRSLGFETVGERKNYYPALDGRENAWVMCLEAGYKIATDPIAII